MVDTVRTRAELLQTIFADGQGAGSITPQDMRDFIVSTYGLSGWADYVDDQYTTGAPFSVSASTDTIVPNNAGTKREQELPLDYTDLYDELTGKIPGKAGDSMLITIEFKIRRASGSGTFSLETFFDIGAPVGEIYNRIHTLSGSGEQNITFTTAVYTLDTWETNGALFKVNTSVATEIYDIRFVVHRLHRGQGTYPPV